MSEYKVSGKPGGAQKVFEIFKVWVTGSLHITGNQFVDFIFLMGCVALQMGV